MDEGGDGSTLRLVVVALDSGNLAEDQLATMIPSEPAPNRVLELLGLGRTAEWFNRRPVKPAAEQLRKASNALDAFHRDLEIVVDAIGDPRLRQLEQQAAAWGTTLWERSVGPIDVYNELRPVLAELLRHRSRLILGRSLPDD